MLLNEQLSYDHGTDRVVVKKTHDFSDSIKRAQIAREQGIGVTGDNRYVGTVDLDMVAQWCKEAGVSWDDVEARKDVVKRKLLSGEFDKLRVWRGNF